MNRPMRKLCIFGSHHKYQMQSPINPFFGEHLLELIRDHHVDMLFEEATGLPRQSSVESLADKLRIGWMNIDLSREQRKTIDDAANRSIYDTFQDLTLHECRENYWVERVTETKFQSGLIVCGLCHVLSLGQKLLGFKVNGVPCFEIEAHVYDPRRDEP
jgi:hypothetical protein